MSKKAVEMLEYDGKIFSHLKNIRNKNAFQRFHLKWKKLWETI